MDEQRMLADHGLRTEGPAKVRTTVLILEAASGCLDRRSRDISVPR